MDFIELLKQSIRIDTPLSDIVRAFEKMCSIPIDNDLILFETGTYSFTGQPLFYFSLVRQFPKNDGEYYQIHTDILYRPDKRNKKLHNTVWSDSIKGDIFEYIRNSKAFEYAEPETPQRIDIYMDET